MATISMQGVRKSYAKTEVIHGIDLEIADGQFVVIVGPSGCGKSTLLRMVAGLEVISGGTIRIGERVVNDLEPKDRDIAMVFQNYALYPHMSVFQNMAYGLKIAGTPRAEIRARVDEAASLLQLSDFLERKPRQLSGGQRQRVAMGRAIVRKPSVFLFDEPLSNLDAKLRVQMRLEIKQLQRRLGTTSLYVTHDQVEAMTLGDLLVVMNAGVAEQIASPLEIYEKPATLFVAGFIGSPAMNFMPARIEGGALLLPGGETVPDEGMPLAAMEGRAVTLGIRPEHLSPAGPDAPLHLHVTLVETLGADTLAHGTLGPDGPPCAVRLPGNATPASGEVLTLAAAPQALHLFDPDSGQRIEGS